jgi:hypothetical protein
MALNLDAIRKRLNQLSGNNTQQNIFWKLSEGEEATIRLLAYPNNNGQPFKELYFYYNIGSNRGLLAPYQYGKPDPFQELISKLREENSPEASELVKKLYPKMRCYAPVIVRGEEEKGVQIWSFGKQLYQTFLSIMLDEDYGDITNPLTGRDLKVKSTKMPGRSWPSTEALPRGSQTPLSKNQEQAKQWLDNIPDLDSVFTLKSYEELEKIINDWLSEDSDDSNDNDDFVTTRGGSSQTTSTSVETKTFSSSESNFRSLDDAFSDLEDL